MATDTEFEQTVNEVNTKIEKLCNAVNDRMDWMKTGVMLAWIPSSVALILSVVTFFQVITK